VGWVFSVYLAQKKKNDTQEQRQMDATGKITEDIASRR
jgi:hypothetical protein